MAIHHVRPVRLADAERILEIYGPLVSQTAISFEIGGRFAGYAYAARRHERPAYQWSVNTSVYVAPGLRGQGVGSAALHESLGFKHLGTYEDVGYKAGKWRSVGWWKLQLQEYRPEPADPIPFSELRGRGIACNWP